MPSCDFEMTQWRSNSKRKHLSTRNLAAYGLWQVIICVTKLQLTCVKVVLHQQHSSSGISIGVRRPWQRARRATLTLWRYNVKADTWPHDIGRHLTYPCITSVMFYALIKCMCKQWTPGPFLRFSNGHGNDATLSCDIICTCALCMCTHYMQIICTALLNLWFRSWDLTFR